MSADARHRTVLTVLVAVAATLVVAALIAGSPVIHGLVSRLPAVPAEGLASLVAVACLVGAAVSAIALLVRDARVRARRTALARRHPEGLACAIRVGPLAQRMNELRLDNASPIRISRRYSIVADESGIAFWDGGRRPRMVDSYPWREVRNIRADATVAGTGVLSVLVLRVRRHKNSVELPVVLASGRPGRFALSDAAFFAVVREWKAKHRTALAAEGLEVPPLTAPIPVITAAMAREDAEARALAAARR
ncbi:hypothetical protein BJ978_000892 [Agromyces terreus]|uniref:PH domain-containing protein n=1 Tax=Agromyces terreus TaxID=424795 RepID=A0A9X2GZ99_9MICO|nr:hypothetical protein [Agromyces terreus]MCP2370216.1 hypothetical protein [Agromyces terreus]